MKSANHNQMRNCIWLDRHLHWHWPVLAFELTGVWSGWRISCNTQKSFVSPLRRTATDRFCWKSRPWLSRRKSWRLRLKSWKSAEVCGLRFHIATIVKGVFIGHGWGRLGKATFSTESTHSRRSRQGAIGQERTLRCVYAARHDSQCVQKCTQIRPRTYDFILCNCKLIRLLTTALEKTDFAVSGHY